MTIVDAGFILSRSYLNPQAYQFAYRYIYYSFYFHRLDHLLFLIWAASRAWISIVCRQL